MDLRDRYEGEEPVPTIRVYIHKGGERYACKLENLGPGWLFGWLYAAPDGRTVWRGDGMVQGGWPMALNAALEWAKTNFGFKDVIITDIHGEEYLEPK